MIVTIDGPAGSGKSTAARKLAARMEIPYLDTGAMYRAVAYAGLRRQVAFEDAETVAALARALDIQLDCGPTHTRIRVDGHDVTEAIRTMEVTAATSLVARHPAVRRVLIDLQRKIGAGLGSFITEGRDQGSVVFPNADFKFVLEANVERRAERRYQEMSADGESVSYQAILDNIRSRDGADSKQWEPLLEGGGAVVIDTSQMSIAEVVERMVRRLGEKPGGAY